MMSQLILIHESADKSHHTCVVEAHPPMLLDLE